MKKKKYFNVYLDGHFVAIIKDEKDLHDFLIDRATIGNYNIQRDKFPPSVEELETFASYNPEADIVETVAERRYRDLIIGEWKERRKTCKKELKKLEEQMHKCKKGSRKYIRLKAEFKMLQTTMNTLYNKENIHDSISDTIIHQPYSVKEYLQNNEIIGMIARGEI